MELNQIFKYIILALLISLAILTVTYKFDDCNLCSFEINNTKYSAQSMANLYYNECLFKEPTNELIYNFTKFNIPS